MFITTLNMKLNIEPLTYDLKAKCSCRGILKGPDPPDYEELGSEKAISHAFEVVQRSTGHTVM